MIGERWVILLEAYQEHKIIQMVEGSELEITNSVIHQLNN